MEADLFDLQMCQLPGPSVVITQYKERGDELVTEAESKLRLKSWEQSLPFAS